MTNRRPFVDTIINPGAERLRENAPLLQFQYHPENHGIIATNAGGYILSREEFEDLIEWMRSAYTYLGDDAIDNENTITFQERQKSHIIHSTKVSAPDLDPSAAPLPPQLPVRPAQPGFVYLLHAPLLNYYKIGRTKDVNKRLANILLPFPFHLVHSIATPDMIWAERHLHKHFAQKRLDGEWFTLGTDDVQWLCAFTELEPES
jgi:hypothetical protein